MKNIEILKDNINNSITLGKKTWISITGLCNNNCLFCLDKERSKENRIHRSSAEVKNQIKKALEEGKNKLVISGGDPTIHPNIIEFVDYAKTIGFEKVQIITNGRMFASKEFTDRIIEVGLDEVTFSIHGHTKELHDELTQVQGSFIQTLKGIRNVFKNKIKIIVNADVVLNKKNVDRFSEIISFLLKCGIREIAILQIIPFGNAWKNWKNLSYNMDEKISKIRNGFDIVKKAGAVLWTSRFPVEYLEGYEELVEDPTKILDEIMSRKDAFELLINKGQNLRCHGERCQYCYMNEFCSFLDGKIKSAEKANKKDLLTYVNQFVEDKRAEIKKLKIK